jgi:hypothetical protein
MKILRTLAISLLAPTLFLSLPAQAAQIQIYYNFSGGLTAPPVLVFPVLHLNGSATGTVNQSDPLENAAWNPVTFVTVDDLNLFTGLDHGTFTWTLADGDKLSGLMFEDDTTVNFSTNTGPFTQMLTFTGGTGHFAGVSGASFGQGSLAPSGYTVIGRGILHTPGVPEPAAWAMMLLGFGGLGAVLRRRRGQAVLTA